jgi:hypothetical protein
MEYSPGGLRMSKLAPAVFLTIVVMFIGACDSAPQIKSVEPSFGNISGNDDVVIVGTGFKPGIVVRFGKSEVNNLVIESNTRIKVKTPSGVEGKVDVEIIQEDGKTLVLKNGFSYMRDAPSGK